MRGKDIPFLGTVGIPGITPAYAGKSRPILTDARNDKDHPRVCGEKCLPDRRARIEWGSPPRMRGKEKMQKLF